MNDEFVNDDLLDPERLTGLDLPPERLREVAETFEAIRREIEKLRAPDPEKTSPAVVHRPTIRAISDE